MIEEPEETVDQLEQQGEELDKDIEETKDDWERKQESADVPGAVPGKDSAGTPNASPPNPDPPDDG